MPRGEILRGGIRLPGSPARGARGCYCKLLSAVDPDAQHGFGFEGKLFRPGQLVTAAELRPSLEYPSRPVVLEMSFTEAHGPLGHRRRDSVYTLWRGVKDARDWEQLGCAVAQSWEWAIELRALAVRALAEAAGEVGVVTLKCGTNIPAIAVKISEFLENEIKTLTPPERVHLLACLHDEIATRIRA